MGKQSGISALCSEGFPSGQREQTVNLPVRLRRFESFPLHHFCGHSLVVEPQPSKLMMRVRFPLPAPRFAHVAQSVEHFLGKEEVTGSNPVMSSSLKDRLRPVFLSASKKF